MDISLSKEQIEALLRRRINVVSLTSDMKILYECVRRRLDRGFLVHYQTKNVGSSRSGHWCSLRIKPRQKEIWFFDSYGEFPDDQLESIDPRYRKKTHQEDRKLGEFMYRCTKIGWRVRYNEYQYQQLKDRVNTCGRWSAVWLDSGLSPEKFHTVMERILSKTNLSPDQLIVAVTQDLLP